MFKKMIMMATIALIFAPAFALALPVQAQTEDSDQLLWGGTKTGVQESLELGEEDPRIIIARVINVALGFLGIIAVVLIIYGGFLWMTAAGNEDNITKAKGIITAGIIGLVIILAAWGIAKFVIDSLFTATGAG